MKPSRRVDAFALSICVLTNAIRSYRQATWQALLSSHDVFDCVQYDADYLLGDYVRSMKNTVFTLAVLPLLLSACATTPVVERTTDLGFGFRRVVLAEPSQASFESIGHFEYLYFGDRRLCQVDACSVSPSGRYAVYQDGPSGDLFLFRRVDGRLTRLTSQFVALVDTFDWHENVSTVEAHFTSGHGA